MTAPLQRWVLETHFPADMTLEDITAAIVAAGASVVRAYGPPALVRFCPNVTVHPTAVVAAHIYDGEPICWDCLMRFTGAKEGAAK